jgi:hypothetical protein
VLGWKGRPADGEPDVVGIPKLKHIKRKHGRNLPVVALKGLPQGVNEAARVAQALQVKLDEFRERIRRLPGGAA